MIRGVDSKQRQNVIVSDVLKLLQWCWYLNPLTLSLLMSHICGVSKMFGEWYQKTKKTEDTNKLTLLAFKIIKQYNFLEI
jgi:hypothetical protein